MLLGKCELVCFSGGLLLVDCVDNATSKPHWDFDVPKHQCHTETLMFCITCVI